MNADKRTRKVPGRGKVTVRKATKEDGPFLGGAGVVLFRGSKTARFINRPGQVPGKPAPGKPRGGAR